MRRRQLISLLRGAALAPLAASRVYADPPDGCSGTFFTTFAPPGSYALVHRPANNFAAHASPPSVTRGRMPSALMTAGDQCAKMAANGHFRNNPCICAHPFFGGLTTACG